MTDATASSGPSAALLISAIEYAARAHAGQTRKDGRTPYIVHPVAVMRRLSTDLDVADTEVLAAAVLHDVLEDTPHQPDELGREFGLRVLEMVRELTLPSSVHGPSVPDEAKTQAILQSLEGMSWEAVVIKLCDRIDNLGDIEFTPWSELKRQNYRSGSLRIADSAERRLTARPPGGPLSARAGQAIAMLRRAAAPADRAVQDPVATTR